MRKVAQQKMSSAKKWDRWRRGRQRGEARDVVEVESEGTRVVEARAAEVGGREDAGGGVDDAEGGNGDAG